LHRLFRAALEQAECRTASAQHANGGQTDIGQRLRYLQLVRRASAAGPGAGSNSSVAGSGAGRQLRSAGDAAMKPQRPSSFVSAFPIGRGHPTPAEMVSRAERDRYLREAAAFYPRDCADREVALQLRKALLIYRAGSWRRDQNEALCPVQYQGTLKQALWCVLKSRDLVPSDRTIRAALARS
jgi:hypothetical protein